MAAPKYEIIQTDYQNPDASDTLKLNLLVISNTPEEQLIEYIKDSSRKYSDWLQLQDPHDGVAVLIGGGDSINDHVEDIQNLQKSGATIVTMNNSAMWAREHGVEPDIQVIVDAKQETSVFVDDGCWNVFASQCHPDTLAKAGKLTLAHFGAETIEEFLPEERVKKGGYVLLGCGTTVGNAALSVAFSQGYREMHIFGYDSSYREGKSHGYAQPMNEFMPTTEIEWGGKTFTASVAMKGQAEKFPLNALSLKNAGCELHVYGEGLLQTIYNTNYHDLTEREKYQLMWNVESYRYVAPGEHVVDVFLEEAHPGGLIIDFGCGTGRAGIKLSEKGHDVMLMDFTDNCRDQEALFLPFIQADLTEEIPVKGDYGFCTDVMEHIPPEDVESVIQNIMNSTPRAFFQISTVEDQCGKAIGAPLHLTVENHDWWKEKFISLGYKVEWDSDQQIASLFYVSRQAS